MDGNKRRQAIIDILKNSLQPVSGTYLAKTLQVSRQVIVQDIALLRAGDYDIYIWCNRQGILYVTKFHYRKDFSLWFNMKSYYLYFLQKFRYQFAQYAG